MTKKAGITGEPEYRNFVIKTPNNKYVHIYFGLNYMEVSNFNEATRFAEEAAHNWIKTSTSEVILKETGEIVSGEEIFNLSHSELIFRPSTKYSVWEVKTKIIKESKNE